MGGWGCDVQWLALCAPQLRCSRAPAVKQGAGLVTLTLNHLKVTPPALALPSTAGGAHQRRVKKLLAVFLTLF